MLIVRDIIDEFKNFIISNPENKHAKYISHKVLLRYRSFADSKLLEETINSKDEISMIIQNEKGVSKRTIDLFWMGFAYAIEYQCVKGSLSNNGLRFLLPKKPRSGSLIWFFQYCTIYYNNMLNSTILLISRQIES